MRFIRFVCIFVIISSCQLSFAGSKEYYFNRAYEELNNMLSGESSLSFKRSVFVVENAYYEEKIDVNRFNAILSEYATLCRNLAETNIIQYAFEDVLSVNNHAAIFKIMSDTVPIYLNDSTVVFHFPFTYDFDDYAGKKNWSNTFVTNLLATHKGNCHSLPILYKLIAEEMGEKAWLSLAPNHFYIKLRNRQSGWYNTELTSGQFPADVWIKSSSYVHTDAIRNGIYMDTLSLRNSVALCLVDLAQVYQYKHPGDYDPSFVLKCCDTALEHFPNYINALLLRAETLLDIYQKSERKSEAAYKEIEKLYVHIHKLGYRKMPEKMYQEWLGSLKKERGRYQLK